MNFRNWSIAEVEAHNARVTKQLMGTPDPKPSRGEALEETLAQKIIDECKRRGWMYKRSRTDKKTTRPVGELDFDIKADRGRSFNIECKARGGKPSPAQLQSIAWLRKLGHQADCVWTIEEFLEIIK